MPLLHWFQLDLFDGPVCRLSYDGCRRRMALVPAECLPPYHNPPGWDSRYGGFCHYHGVLYPSHPAYDWRFVRRWVGLRNGPGIHTGRHRTSLDVRIARADALLAEWWAHHRTASEKMTSDEDTRA
jgi:hypothetical protein